MDAIRSVRQYQLTMDLAKERAHRLRAEAIDRALRDLLRRLGMLWTRLAEGDARHRAAGAVTPAAPASRCTA